ncbi:MAG TPA: DUF4064 domain-containing protein [Bacillales bacterium]|nr:DUF4064 domain-containing protein [Bacillales bacterium]
MKRTGERVLSIIGIVINAIIAAIVTMAVLAFQRYSAQGQLESQMSGNPEMGAMNPDQVMDIIGGVGWVVVAATVIGIIIGLIAVFNLKENKKPKQAGIWLIIGAVVVGVASIGAGWLPALLYLIAGIMCLVRKPSKDPVGL